MCDIKKIGGRIAEVYRSLPSTNDRAKEILRDGKDEVSAVLAMEQTAGRGRYDRRFSSPEGGLYLTVITRKQCPPDTLPLLPLAAGAFASEALDRLGIPGIGIKWVNDLFLNGKKVAGILTEGVFAPEYVGTAVGIGLNLCGRPFPGASSVEEETGVRLAWNTAADKIASALFEGLANYPENLPSVLRSVRERSVLNGREVVVAAGSERYAVYVKGIGEKGELIAERNGKRIEISAGEVSLSL